MSDVKEKERITASPTHRGGRPSRDRAERLRDHILDSATQLFFTSGYGAVSIEAIALHAGISKRTFYARFGDKADLFKAVVHRVVMQLRPSHAALLPAGKRCEENLYRLAQLMAHAAVSPQLLALHRLIVAEGARFPELAMLAENEGARQEAIRLITDMLKSEIRAGTMQMIDPAFNAEQFIQMVISLPQRRALGFGRPMTPHELDVWARKTVKLFLNGCRGQTPGA